MAGHSGRDSFAFGGFSVTWKKSASQTTSQPKRNLNASCPALRSSAKANPQAGGPELGASSRGRLGGSHGRALFFRTRSLPVLMTSLEEAWRKKILVRGIRGVAKWPIFRWATGPLRVTGSASLPWDMSCVPITPEMSFLLGALRGYLVSTDVQEQLRAMPEWQQAREWGWIMRSGELTGTGHRHAGEQPRGILPTGL